MGFVWFLVFSLGMFAIGGSIAEVRTSAQVKAETPLDGVERRSDVGDVSGLRFGQQFGRSILIVAAAAAVAGTAASVLPGTETRTETP